MSNLAPAVWLQLTTLINSTWPEINSQIHRVSKINRENWLNLLNGSSLTPPYVVAGFLRKRKADWGMQNRSYWWDLEIYYIASTGGTTNIEADVEAKLSTFRDDLLVSASTTGFQVPEDPEIDTSDINPANLALYEIQAGLFAGQLTASLLVGETYA